MIKNLLYLILAGAVLYLGIFIVNYLVAIRLETHIDKSGGLAEKIFGSCIFSSLFFYILKRSYKFLGWGFLIGFASNIFLLILYMTIGQSNSGFGFSVLGDQMFVSTVVFLTGLAYTLFSRK